MIDNVVAFIKNLLGSFWGRLFKSSAVYKALVKTLSYFSKQALIVAQGYENSRVITTASTQYPVIQYLQVPLSKIHAKALVIDGTWQIGSAVIGQTVTNDRTVVQVTLPENCIALSSNCTGENLWIKDIDFYTKDDYFVLLGDPAKLFVYVSMEETEPCFDLWVYGTSSGASLEDFSVLTDADLNKIPAAGYAVWDSFTQGVTYNSLNRIISNGLGVDLSSVSGVVQKVWTEEPYNYVAVDGFIHRAPARYKALVQEGDRVTLDQQLFDTHVIYTRGALPEYQEVSEIVLPVSPARFVRIPNYMVPVKTYSDIRYIELTTTAGSFEDSVHSVINNYEVLGIVDESTQAVNALQYVMENVFRDNLIIVKFHHVSRSSATAVNAITQAISSVKPLYACVAVAFSDDSDNSITLTVSEKPSTVPGAGFGNPDTEAVNLVCEVGPNKVGFE